MQAEYGPLSRWRLSDATEAFKTFHDIRQQLPFLRLAADITFMAHAESSAVLSQIDFADCLQKGPIFRVNYYQWQ